MLTSKALGTDWTFQMFMFVCTCLCGLANKLTKADSLFNTIDFSDTHSLPTVHCTPAPCIHSLDRWENLAYFEKERWEKG